MDYYDQWLSIKGDVKDWDKEILKTAKILIEHHIRLKEKEEKVCLWTVCINGFQESFHKDYDEAVICFKSHVSNAIDLLTGKKDSIEIDCALVKSFVPKSEVQSYLEN